MAKCDYCGKGVTFGIKVSHSHRRSNRTWKPNVKRVKAVVNGTPCHVYACTRCLRSNKVERAVWSHVTHNVTAEAVTFLFYPDCCENKKRGCKKAYLSITAQNRNKPARQIEIRGVKRCCKLMPPSDEGGGQPSGCSEGEKTERYRFCGIISKKPTVFLSLSQLRWQLPHQREPWFGASLNSNWLRWRMNCLTKIVCHPERSEAESKDLTAEITHKSILKCEDPSTSFRFAPFRSGWQLL